MQPVHLSLYKNNRSNIWKKHTAPFKYVVKSVLFSVISREVMQNILFYVDIVRVNNILAFKYREYGNN